MNFTDAVRKSMQKFLDGDMSLTELEKTSEEPILYTPEFFDELEEEMLKDEKKKPKKGKGVADAV